MAGFKNKRVGLLIIALLLSILFIVAPWKAPQKEGAPFPNLVRGPNWGVDITGGSRIMLRLEATQITIESPRASAGYAENMADEFSENLECPVKVIQLEENISKEEEFGIEIGKYVSENVVNSLLEEEDSLIDIEKRVSSSTQEEVKNSLKLRVDPYGTLGAQFKPLGEKNQYLQFEVALDLEPAKKLLGREGLPEVFVDNKRVIWSEHIKPNVSTRVSEEKGTLTWGVSFKLTDEGKERFAEYTENKSNRPGVIYLDRPSDSILLFTKEFRDSIVEQAPQVGTIEEGGYSSHRFKYKTTGGYWFYIQVPATEIEENRIPPGSENYILSLKRKEEIKQGLILGKKNDFSDEIILNNNLIIENQSVLPVENLSKLEKGESNVEWLNRIVGLESWPTLSPSITGNVENLERGLQITTGPARGEGSEEAKDEAEDLKIILSQRLPVEVTHISEEEIGGRLSKGFVRQAGIAGVIAFIVVGTLVFSFYRKFKIAIPLLLTMASEVVITLGAASAVPDGLMSIGLPGLGGLIAVVGTGVDHQIIITDEVIGEKFSKSGRLPIDRRTGRAFSVIFAAAATTMAAMLALATFGFGAMRGFAIVTLFGVVISVLITRPAYAWIIGTLLEQERRGG